MSITTAVPDGRGLVRRPPYETKVEPMASVARVTEISAISEKSFEDAVKVGIGRASQTLRRLRSAWIKEQEVQLSEDGSVTGYKVNLLVTFVLE